MGADTLTRSSSARMSMILVVSCLITTVGTAEESPKILRVLTYNIHHGEGVDGKVDLQRQADVIRAAKPDIVALQEVDDRTMRTGKIDQTTELARMTGLHGRFVHQLDFEGGRYGQAILSRIPISDVTLHWLPGTPDRERRMAGMVTFEFHATTIRFVTTHLHHNSDETRKDQARELNRLFAADDEQQLLTFLAGDFNAVPQSEPLELLNERWESATNSPATLTFPAARPERQLDYILFRPLGGANVLTASVLDESVASDHRPLLAEFVLP